MMLQPKVLPLLSIERLTFWEGLSVGYNVRTPPLTKWECAKT